MVKLDLITKNNKENDEYYTPKYAIYPLLKYIKKGTTVWCPFDIEESNFVKLLREYGCKVIFTHISFGQDFFNYIPEEKIDYIISNPPYSLKTEVFKRLFELKIPFAMLVGVVGIFESKKRFGMFRDNPFEVLTFDKRIKFYKSLGEKNPSLNPPFSSVYVCSNILPETYCFEELKPIELSKIEDNSDNSQEFVPIKNISECKTGYISPDGSPRIGDNSEVEK